MNDIEYHGRWWLPDQEENTVGGVLSFSRLSGGELKLFDPIDTVPRQERYSQPNNVDIIHGLVREGERITLYNSNLQLEGESLGQTHAIRQVGVPETILVGAHFDNEAYFDYVDLRFPHLEEWTQLELITAGISKNDSGAANGCEISAKQAVSNQVSLDPVDIHLRTWPSLVNNGASGWSLVQKSKIEIHPNHSLSFSNLREYLKRVQEFLSFASGESLYPDKVTGRIERDSKHPDHKTSIYYRQANYSEPRDSVRPFTLNFTLNDICFAESLESWFNSADSARTLHDLYFSTLFENDTHVRNHFFSMVTSLESHFNNISKNKKLMNKREYEHLWKLALEDMPDDAPAKSRIEDLLRSGLGNEPSLKDKLEEILSKDKDILNEIIDIEKTIKQARDTRHALAHGLSKDDQNTNAQLEPHKLSILSRKMQAIVEIQLFEMAKVDRTHTEEKMISRYGNIP